MSEHKLNDRDRPNRIELPKIIPHPLGWDCSDCFHVVKDSRPMSTAMKCTAHPPRPQALVDSRGQLTGVVAASPPANPGEWCSEFNVRDQDANVRVEARIKEFEALSKNTGTPN